MGKHMTALEIGVVHTLKSQGITPVGIHRKLQRARAARGLGGPGVAAVQRALRGATHERSTVETRGRKPKLSSTTLKTLDATRKRLIAKADGQYEVHWEDIIRAARVPFVDRSTAARAMKAAGYDVKWRTPRLKPARSKIDKKERMQMCDKLRKKPTSFWASTLDAYIDNKKWTVPRGLKGRRTFGA